MFLFLTLPWPWWEKTKELAENLIPVPHTSLGPKIPDHSILLAGFLRAPKKHWLHLHVNTLTRSQTGGRWNILGGFSQYKVLWQTPSNVLGHRLWNFTDQLKGSNPKANPLFFCSFHSPWPLLLSESLFISICLSLPLFQTHLSLLFLSH